MAGSRSLTPTEERKLVRASRRFTPRNHALVVTQLFTGFRISEVLSLTIGHVWDGKQIRDHIGVTPCHLKGGYGATRWVPVGPELRRALVRQLKARERSAPLHPRAPLFESREGGEAGGLKAITRSSAEKFYRRVLRPLADFDPQRLSSHSMRKTWARRLYEVSGHDLLMVRDGLGHSSVQVTQAYLSVNQSQLSALMAKADWTRKGGRGESSQIRRSVI